MLLRLSGYTGCHCRLFLTKIHDLLVDSGVNYMKLWVPNCIFSTVFHPQIDGQSKYSKICFIIVFWNSKIELSEKKLFGTDLISETEENVKVIQNCLKAASGRQKSYVDLKRKDIEFQVGDRMFLKKNVLFFHRKGKINSYFIGQYEIIERIGSIAYHLALLTGLEKIHNVLHLSMLRQYISKPSHVIYQPSEEPARILARAVKELRNKCIALVKALWHRHGVKEAN
ncbi:pol protein [Gossypium australe]|uniref:Pol protein n=1 Tax=Gossypium australe TaxID=47621 RepID=A0A5B6VLI4_9ROSI|nr:pol protein [Gossypium australe]